MGPAQNIGVHLNALSLALGPTSQGSTLDILQRELNLLHQRIDGLEKHVETLKRGFRDYPDHEPHFWDPATNSEFHQNQKLVASEILTPEEFKKLFKKNVSDEQLIDSIFGGPNPQAYPTVEEKKTEELHPAHNSSFVLKI